MKRGIKHNTHPGELLKEEILKANNLSVTEAASMLRVTRAALSNVINEKAAVSPLMALRIAKVFGGSAEFWVRMQSAHDLRNAEIELSKKKLRLKPYKYDVNV
jgi:addiction module HigA family antidote